MNKLITYFSFALLALALLVAGGSSASAQTPAGTRIDNTAKAHYSLLSGRPDSLSSNAASVVVIASTRLSLVKSAAPSSVPPQDTVTFTILVSDTGHAAVPGVVVTDTVPSSFTVLSVNHGAVTGQIVQWTIGSLGAGAADTLRIVAVLSSEVPAGTSVVNTAYSKDSSGIRIVATAPVLVLAAPRLSLTKTASKDTVVYGDTVQYVVRFKNTGNVTLTHFAVVDTLPAFFSGISVSPNAALANGIVTLTRDSLTIGAGDSVVVKGVVQPGAVGGSMIHNVVHAASDQINGTASASSIVRSVPSLVVFKSVSADSANAGDSLVYTIRIVNTGTVPLTGVFIRDTLSVQLGDLAVSSGVQISNGIASLSLDSLNIGASDTVTVGGIILPTAAGNTHIMNTAYAGSQQSPAVHAQVSTLILPKAVLAIAKTASSATAFSGDTLTYTVRVRNVGNLPLTGVSMVDTLPSNFGAFSVSSNAHLLNGIISLQSDTLLPGAADTVTIVGIVQGNLSVGATITNNAYAQANGAPRVHAGVTVLIQTHPVLLITKTASKNAVGSFDTLTYTIRIRNAGNVGLNIVTVTDTIPSIVQKITASPNAFVNGHVVTYERDTLSVGVADSILVTVTMPAGGQMNQNVVNTAWGQSSQTPAEPARATVVFLGASQMSLTKLVSRDSVNTGDSLTYSIIIRNAGIVTLMNIIASDTIPAQVHPAYVSANGRMTGRFVSFAKDSMVVGESDTIFVRGQLDADRPDNERVLNTAWAQSAATPLISAQGLFIVHVFILDHSCRMSMTATPGLVIGNDTAASVLVAFVSDTLGHPKPDGTPITFTTTFGHFSNDSESVVHYTKNGYAVDSLRALVSGNRIISSQAVVSSMDSNVCYSADTINVIFYPGAVTGYVFDRVKDVTVEGALITVTSSNGDTVGTVVTGPDGHYLIPVPKTDTYTVTITIRDSFGQDISMTNQVFIGVPPVGGLPPTPDKNSVSGTIYFFVSNTPIPVPNIEVALISNSGKAFKGGNGKRYVAGSEIDSASTDSRGIYTFNDIPPGQYTVSIHHPRVQGDNSVVNLGGGEYVINTNIPVLLNPEVVFTKTGPDSTLDVDTVTYTINLQNNGTLASPSTVVTDSLDAAMRYVSSNPSGTVDSTGRIVTWNLGTVDSGSGKTVTIRVSFADTLSNSKDLVNSARVRSGGIADTLVQKKTHVLVPGQVRIWKTASVSRAPIGDTVNYTVHMQNVSDLPAAHIVVTDKIPFEVQYLSSDISGLPAGSTQAFSAADTTLTIKFDTLHAGELRQFVIHTVVRKTLPPGDYDYTNVANVLWLGGSSNSDLDTASHASVFTTLPYITVTKTALRKQIEVGEMETYSLVIANTSVSIPAHDITITDMIPFGFKYIKKSSFENGKLIADPAGSTTLTWKLKDTLKAQAADTIVYRLTVGAGAIDGNGINTAVVKATSPSGTLMTTSQVHEQVQVQLGVFSERGLIIGKVFYDDNQNRYQDSGEAGLKGIELMMEDGTRIITGDDGKYSLPDVAPGDHVIRLREYTLPKGDQLELGWDEFAGKASSRFVKVPESGIARADFYVKRYVPPPPVAVNAQLAQSAGLAGTITLQRIAEPRNVVFIEDERWAPLKLPGSNFDVGKANLHPEAYAMLSAIVQILKENPDQGVLITGHTDSVAIHTPEFPSNTELSEARAMAVKTYLVKHEHIDPSRIDTKGYGPDQPITTNTTKEGRAVNRRVEVYLNKQVNTPKRSNTTVVFRVPVNYEGLVPVGRVEIHDILDPAFEFVVGSGLMGDRVITPQVKGNELTWVIDSIGTSFHGMIQYEASVLLPSEKLKTIYSSSTIKYWLGDKVLANDDTARTENEIAIAARGKAVNYILPTMMFDIGKASVRANALSSVQTAAELLQASPTATATVEGHTDSVRIHTAEFPSNMELSLGRAENVLDHLVRDFHIDSTRLQYKGYGELRPLMSNSTPEGRSLNRRVEIRIIKKEFYEETIKDGLIDSSMVLRHTFVPTKGAYSFDSTATVQPGDQLVIELEVNLPKNDQTLGMTIIDSLPQGLAFVPATAHKITGLDTAVVAGNILTAPCTLDETPKIVSFIVQCTADQEGTISHTFHVERRQKNGKILINTSTPIVITVRKSR